MQVAIVGAGASGSLAAIVAARRGARVTLYDTNAQVGRKLLITGNGRCNLSNARASAERYMCADLELLGVALRRFGVEATLELFESLGIPVHATHDGWYYPLSDSAASVADILAQRLDELGVSLRLQTKVADLRLSATKGWELALGGPEKWVAADRVIVACGGVAYPALGSKGELFPVLQRLGHTVAPLRPALTPIRAKVARFHALQGVRLDVEASLWQGDACLGRTLGNVMFTQYGFSGPAAMDLAHLISEPVSDHTRLQIDVLAGRRVALQRVLADRPEAPLRVALESVLPPKLARALPELVGLYQNTTAGSLGVDAVERMGIMQAQVTGTRGLKEAQLSRGGVPLVEVDPKTMASRLLPGLHLCGEVLDVLGPCGGYNLQWAWTSGALAGAAAAREGWT